MTDRRYEHDDERDEPTAEPDRIKQIIAEARQKIVDANPLAGTREARRSA